MGVSLQNKRGYRLSVGARGLSRYQVCMILLYMHQLSKRIARIHFGQFFVVTVHLASYAGGVWFPYVRKQDLYLSDLE
jgi:hypothetical protein